MNKKQIVLDLMQRSQSHLNGVSAIFAKAGIKLNGTIPSVNQFNSLCKYHPELFCELIDYLYPEHAGKANAHGSAWAAITGAALRGLGQIFTEIDSTSGNEELQKLEYERSMAELQAQESRKTLYIILGVIGGVAVLGIALFLMLSNRR